MKKEEKTAVIEHLKNEQEKVARRVASLKELTQPIAPDCSIGRVSRMDAINNKSVNDAALRTAQDKLKAIEYALEHLDDPDFGVCRTCGEPIPIRRLIAMPGSSQCMSCARR